MLLAFPTFVNGKVSCLRITHWCLEIINLTCGQSFGIGLQTGGSDRLYLLATNIGCGKVPPWWICTLVCLLLFLRSLLNLSTLFFSACLYTAKGFLNWIHDKSPSKIRVSFSSEGNSSRRQFRNHRRYFANLCHQNHPEQNLFWVL